MLGFYLGICKVSAQADTLSISANDTTIIGFAKYDLYPKLPEGNLGNFIADAVKTAVQLKWGNKIDVAIISPQAIKGKIERGVFKKNKILSLLPYPDSIVIIKADAAQLTKILDKVASEGGGAISGATMQINNMLSDSIRIDRIPLNSEQLYMVAMPYYLYLKKKMPIEENSHIFNANITIQNAVCAYIIWLQNKGKTISPVPYKRIKYTY